MNFYEQTKSAGKIAVVDLGFLGDSVHLVPALWEIKRHYPQAQLHTLSAPVGAELMGLARCVDRAWAFPLTPQSPAWWRHWDIIGALRREKFDAAFNFSGADRTIFLTALTGAKWRLAHEGGRHHFWNRWLIGNWVPRRSRELPVYEQRRQVLAAAGFSLKPARFDLLAPEKARECGGEYFGQFHSPFDQRERGGEGMAPGELDQTGAADFAERRGGATGGDGGGQRAGVGTAGAAGEVVRDARLVCLPGLNIGQLAALLQRCRLHIGADSGVLHLAAALGISTFTVFRKYPG